MLRLRAFLPALQTSSSLLRQSAFRRSMSSTPIGQFPRVVFIGAPGVGKGTYASRLCKQFKVPHMSVGDYVRKEIKEKTDLGEEIKTFVEKGSLVPDTLITEVLKHALAEISNGSESGGFVLDGFPRTEGQAEMLEGIVDLDFVLNLVQEESVTLKKISGRRVCPSCGHGYNIADIWNGPYHMPALLPKVDNICDECQTPLIQRSDDAEDIVLARLHHYHDQSKPVEHYYERTGKLVTFEILGGVEHHYQDLVYLMLNTRR